MSGLSTTRSGIENISKQYGSILRGYGPPVPKAGVIGDLYIDSMTCKLFEKRRVGKIDDWGHYLWIVPSTYCNGLKWFGASKPNNSFGDFGDYFLQWAGYNNYGMQPTIWGPKLWTGWFENEVPPIEPPVEPSSVTGLVNADEINFINASGVIIAKAPELIDA